MQFCLCIIVLVFCFWYSYSTNLFESSIHYESITWIRHNSNYWYKLKFLSHAQWLNFCPSAKKKFWALKNLNGARRFAQYLGLFFCYSKMSAYWMQASRLRQHNILCTWSVSNPAILPISSQIWWIMKYSTWTIIIVVNC